MIYGRWNVAGYNRQDAVRLTRGGLNPLTAVLLASRGITGAEEIRGLMCRGADCLSDPFLMADMDLAVERVRRAIENNEHITVYGDYDVDGITSSCLVADYLRERGVTCDIYIPERLEEGYGIKNTALDTIKAGGTSLVISVDCGITAAENRRYAESLGMDMVITDHHEVKAELPAPPAVDPRRPDCPSPAKMLAGVGVAFKLICAVEGIERTGELLRRYGDLVALGTVADVMPVTGENRFLIQRGLELMRAGNRPGIAALCAAASVDISRLSVMNIGFVIAPRINAAGRLGGTDIAVELLLTQDPARASALAERLCALNRERQCIEGRILEDALRMLDENPPEGRPIVLASSAWHQGVAGIVASRVAERFHLPTIMICVKDGVGRGSCRSVGSYNIFEALDSCRELLINFGGHEMAAGLTIDEANVGALRERLGERFIQEAQEDTVPELDVDFEVVKPEILSVQNIQSLESLEPYGIGNPQPVLCLRNVTVDRTVPLSEGKHTKLWVSRDDIQLPAVFFGKTIEELGAQPGGLADIVFYPQVNEFRGRRTPQLHLLDFDPK